MFTEQYSHRNAGENTSILRVRPFYSYYTRAKDCVTAYDERLNIASIVAAILLVQSVDPRCRRQVAACTLKQLEAWSSFECHLALCFAPLDDLVTIVIQSSRFVICVNNLHLARRHSPRRRSRLSLRRCAVKTPHSGLCCVAWQLGIYKRSTQLWEKTLKQQLNLYSFTCCLESRQSKQQKGMWIINTKMRPKIPFAYNKTCANRNHIFDF